MNRRAWPALALLALLAPAALPSAGACSIAYPEVMPVALHGDGSVTYLDGPVVRRASDGASTPLGRATPWPEALASPDGSVVVYGFGPENGMRSASCDFSPYEVRRWTPDDEFSVVGTFGEYRLRAADWTADRVFLTDGDRVKVVDLATGRESLDFRPGGEGGLLGQGKPRGHVSAIAVSADGSRVAAVRERDAFVHDASDGRLLHRVPLAESPSWATRVSLDPTGALLAVAHSEGDGSSRLRVEDLTGEAPRQVAVRNDPRRVEALAFSPDGSSLAVTFQRAGFEEREAAPAYAAVLDTTLEPVSVYAFPGKRFGPGLAWSPDGERLGFAVNGTLHLTNATLRPVATVPRHDPHAAADERVPGPGEGDRPRDEARPVPSPAAVAPAALALAALALRTGRASGARPPRRG